MRRLSASIFALMLAAGAPVQASSLRVAPVCLDIRAPGATATIRVWNDAPQPVNVQIRIFRWNQQDGEERLVPTQDVVVSPPITTLAGGGENIVRVVRVAKKPISAEESYRVIVDELPDPARRNTGTITLVIRHSIPVFFGGTRGKDSAIDWSVQRRAGGYQVSARNTGAGRLRLSNLILHAGNGAIARRDGLVGYALAGATMRWLVFSEENGGSPSGPITISAESEAGPVNAAASLQDN
ncbi:MAG: fimbrial biogenesis chaperone [Sphingomonadaceae bacterium]